MRGGLPMVLGSGSPRRKEMLERLGMELVVDPPNVDETAESGVDAQRYVQEIAARKWQATFDKWQARKTNISAVLTADTVVSIDGCILQKPSDPKEARVMLDMLVGRTHEVLSAYKLWSMHTSSAVERLVCSRVRFRHASTAELDWYVRQGEGLDKAGGYAVQGIGAVFVQAIEGSYSNVVGLPLCELWTDLCDLGIIELDAPHV